MKKPVFLGSGVAIVTPFSKEGVDYKKLGELVDFHLENNTDAIVVCGSTGEASTMPDYEHIEVVRFTVERVAGRVPVVAGTGSNDTAHGVKLCQAATKAGADALLVVTPYYNKASQEGLYRHIKAMADTTRLPIILYNVPSRTNLNIDPDTVKRLSEIQNIVGLKECNLLQVPEIVRLCGDDMVLYSGEDGLVVPMLSLGAKGVISVVANIAPQQTSELVHSYLRGDTKKSLSIQLEMLPLIKALFSDVSPIPIKTALNYLGWNVGSCRLPLCEMSTESAAKLYATIDKYKFSQKEE